MLDLTEIIQFSFGSTLDMHLDRVDRADHGDIFSVVFRSGTGI